MNLNNTLPQTTRSSIRTNDGMVSPKQPPSQRRRDWYPYYAAFTETFVENVLIQHLGDATSVLDPWSGSGTTAAVCLKHGLLSTGVDINPSLTIIARARLVPASAKQKLLATAEIISAQAARSTIKFQPSDMLASWFDQQSIDCIRSLQQAIHVTNDQHLLPQRDFVLSEQVDEYSSETCFYYTALFFAVRSLLHDFRSTNPMWIKLPADKCLLVAPTRSEVITEFRSSVYSLAHLLSAPRALDQHNFLSYTTGDATSLSYADNAFDAVISSPPYATRIDYVRGTLPELFVLGANKHTILDLRQRATGSPVVRDAARRLDLLDSGTANELLRKVASHKSKGSMSYYHPWMKNYFIGLQKGLHEIDRVVKPDGHICLVVQDSRYKEFHINLQQIVIDTMEARGINLLDRNDHPAPNPRFSNVALVNGGNRCGKNMESLLVFKKAGS